MPAIIESNEIGIVKGEKGILFRSFYTASSGKKSQ
jgi:hypothetical protein